MSGVAIRGLGLSFGTTVALDNISLDFPEGHFFGLLGPSGSGKTTLLRCIAGFIFPQTGTIRIAGEPVETVPVEKREIGMVFQNYALFPNMSVAENVGFGLRVRKLRRSEIDRRVREVLALVRLGDLGGRRPHQLSGGQRQRVALARAIVTRPRVLLLDEPLSALDKSLRTDMQIELKRIQREVGITTIFVTHDQEEALTLSDRIGILRDGRLVQEGEPKYVYRAPLNRFAACFLGEANVFVGRRESDGLRLPGGTRIFWPDGKPPLAPDALLAVRPEMLSISASKPAVKPGINILQGFLDQVVFAGAIATCLVRAEGQVIKVLSKGEELARLPQTGDVWLSWPVSLSFVILPD
jgi:putative spermidine/putrescine transport system ATP-binding protein